MCGPSLDVSAKMPAVWALLSGWLLLLAAMVVGRRQLSLRVFRSLFMPQPRPVGAPAELADLRSRSGGSLRERKESKPPKEKPK